VLLEETRRGALTHTSLNLGDRRVMAMSAPRVDSRLVAAVELLDDPTVRIAETNRRLGVVAGALGLPRPSYEEVRRLVHEYRRLGPRPGAGAVLLDVAFRVRPPTALGDYFVGTLPPEAPRRR
jgi:hypothetical protein